jgi:disulfide bond formation protein DsbB
MDAVIDRESPMSVMLDRVILRLMLLALAGILTAAMAIQFIGREIPCPLCLLERAAMFGCCFGLMQQLRSGGSQRGAGIGLVFSVLLLVISARQTLLDLFPRPGHAYIGGAVFGVHMPVWSVFIAVALLLGFAVRLAIFGGPSLSYSRRALACVSFGGGMIADVRVLLAFSPLDGRHVYERVGGMTTGGGAFLPRRSGAEG